jgi:hypothetical protein
VDKQKIKEERNMDLNHSNMENDDHHAVFKSSVNGFYKTSSQATKVIKMTDGGDSFIREIDDSPERMTTAENVFQPNKDNFDIIHIIMKKFNNKKKEEETSKPKRPMTAQVRPK